ncbi:MAG: hypothetical protein O2860_09800 [Chloroflexi bacterium]|nr:hypothetical protein [Chloroflexota bacterium]
MVQQAHHERAEELHCGRAKSAGSEPVEGRDQTKFAFCDRLMVSGG